MDVFKGYFYFLGAFLFSLTCLNIGHAYQELDSVLKDSVFDLNAFINNLNDQDQPQTLESTLVELKKVEPHFFDHYVLMYKSRSLQTSSFMYPRVLLSSENSTTVISYNGNPEDHGYDKLEVMSFDPQSAKFIFNEIGFSNGYLKLSQNNPKKCMSCHQNSSRTTNDPRPNWEPYSIWPGAYSSLAVGGHDLFNPKSPKHDPILTRDAKSENEQYQIFLDEIVPSHPRYNLLKPMEPNDRGVYFPAIGTPKEAPNKFTTIFTDQLLHLNILRVARLIKDSEIINDYKKVVYGVARCSKLYLPKKIFDWHRKSIHPDLEETFSREDLPKTLELIFHPYGISTQDWSMDFGTGAKFAFRHRFGGPQNFVRSFSEALKIAMPELSALTCADLKDEIMNQDFEETKPLRETADINFEPHQNSQPQLLSRCTNCHTSFAFGAPYIPFDNEIELSQALKDTGYPRGDLKQEIFYRIGVHAQFFERMPADGYMPTAEEVEALKTYLDML